MSERGIIFSAPMVNAILQDRKTETRRLSLSWLKLKAKDRIWVRETWAISHGAEGDPDLIGYRADGKVYFWDGANLIAATAIRDGFLSDGAERWRPSIYLPRKYSRITLELTANPYHEPLQNLSDAAAKREGMDSCTPGDQFRVLWDHINPGRIWADNPNVVVLKFRRVS